MNTTTHVQFNISVADLEKLAEVLEAWETNESEEWAKGLKIMEEHPDLLNKVVEAVTTEVGSGPDGGFDVFINKRKLAVKEEARRRKSFSLRMRSQIHEILSNPGEHAQPTILL